MSDIDFLLRWIPAFIIAVIFGVIVGRPLFPVDDKSDRPKSCFWGHRWNKWTEIRYDILGGGILYKQRRTCKDCGKIKETSL
jgi:hypothetical protein